MRGTSPIPAVDLLGVRVHRITLGDAARAILDLAQAGGAHQIVTLNGAMLAEVSSHPELRAIVNRASLVIPDGAGVLLAGRILGFRLPERVPGIDLVDRVCAEGAGRSLRIFCLGARPGIAAAAGEVLTSRHRGIAVVGTQDGYFSEAEDAAVTARIRTAGPQVLLVAMGFPRQERWIATHLFGLGDVVCLGVGGTFDVLAGRIRRAPAWMHRAGLEWVYRLLREPRRWRTAAVLPRVLWRAVAGRFSRGKKELQEG